MIRWFKNLARDRAIRRLHTSFLKFRRNQPSVKEYDRELSFRWFWQFEAMGENHVRAAVNAQYERL